jgi:acyl dehydratase
MTSDREVFETPQASYFEDLHVGQRFMSGAYGVDETKIKAFASEYDPQPFHLDLSRAEESFFGGLVASGWHTASITMRLLVNGGLPFAGGLIGAGGELSWPQPTRPGDTLSVESEILDIAPSRSKPDRGMVTVRSVTRNQKGEALQIMTAKLVVPRRPAT